MTGRKNPGKDSAPYPEGCVDLSRMNRALRHRLRNLCAGVKMTIERISETAAKTHPQLVDRCRIVSSEMDSLQRMTDRMDLLFDALPAPRPIPLFELLSELRELFVKAYPFCSLELSGPEVEVVFPKGAWLRTVLWELLQNAGEAAGANGRVDLGWRLSGGEFHFEMLNGGSPIPDEIPLDPPQPFHTPRSRHDGIGLSIVCRICKEAGFGVKVSRARDGQGASASISIPPGEFLNGQQQAQDTGS